MKTRPAGSPKAGVGKDRGAGDRSPPERWEQGECQQMRPKPRELGLELVWPFRSRSGVSGWWTASFARVFSG